MTHEICIPPRVNWGLGLSAKADTYIPAVEPIRVNLVDPVPTMEIIQDMIYKSLEDDTPLEAILIPSVAYLSVRNYLDSQVWRNTKSSGPNGLTYMDVRLLFDPRTDRGALIPVYTDQAAWDVFAMRKAQ